MKRYYGAFDGPRVFACKGIVMMYMALDMLLKYFLKMLI